MSREPLLCRTLVHPLAHAGGAAAYDAKSSQRWPVDKRPDKLCHGVHMPAKRPLPIFFSRPPIGVDPDSISDRRPVAGVV